MPEQNPPIKPTPKPTPIAEEPDNPAPFRGFLLAAYRSLAKNTRSLKITRTALISYLLILVIIPPIFITIAFFAFPSQAALFFKFQLKTREAISPNSGPQVLGESTSNASQVKVLGEFVTSVLEPQAVAAVRTLRVVSPQKVSNICLPTEGEVCGASQSAQPNASTSASSNGNEATGPQSPGPAGPVGATGLQGLQGPAGAVGATGSVVGTLSTGDGLSGNITGGGGVNIRPGPR